MSHAKRCPDPRGRLRLARLIVDHGSLYGFKVEGQYSTDPLIAYALSLSAALNISAFAGPRLRAESGVGVEVFEHDVKAASGSPPVTRHGKVAFGVVASGRLALTHS